jgi:four helix bundle protein
MGFKSFEEIEAWKEARILMQRIRKICKLPKVKHEFHWIDQITRAALSIMANIAEGNDANTNAEFVSFLGYAKRSSTEVRSHLYYALDEGYISQDGSENLLQAHWLLR